MNNLINTIKEDCMQWEKLNNATMLRNSYLGLVEFKDSTENGMYGLFLNGEELWYGNLKEINAVVKSMLYLLMKDYEPRL